MKALSILQPWAFAILRLGKDVENRDWRTHFCGRFLIHAGQGFDPSGYQWLRQFDQSDPAPRSRAGRLSDDIAAFARGGIVGSAVLRDCVRASASPWFRGKYGFVLQGVEPCTFVPCRGMPGFFDVPDALLAKCGLHNLAHAPR